MNTNTNTGAALRPLYAIASDALQSDTLKGSARVYASAYLEPMRSLSTIRDTYGADDGASIVRYALANLTGWRGELARTVKAELRAHLDA